MLRRIWFTSIGICQVILLVGILLFNSGIIWCSGCAGLVLLGGSLAAESICERRARK